jgi:hypothetical protein
MALSGVGIGELAGAALALGEGLGAAGEAGGGVGSGLSWAEQSGILREAAAGKGNFGLGSASSADADVLGEAWVGENPTLASDGRTMVSEDGLRQYRPPTYKPQLDAWQANFEQRMPGTRGWFTNGHLDIAGLL